jgi:tagatose 1,6-diphosphate aldolase
MPENCLSVGKLRGLTATSTPEGVFTILAFDHRQSFVRMLNPQAPQAVTYAEVVAAKSDVVRALAPHASAVLLDPVYGAAQVIASGALPGRAGLLVAVEETGYTGSEIARVSSLLRGWSVEKAKRMGADAVKFLVYYHPFAGELTAIQEDLIAEVIQSCREADLAFFLEPVSYSIDPEHTKNSAGFAAQLPHLMVEIAHRLGALGPDVLKLEFPANATYDTDEISWERACRAVSAASPCPWAVLSAGVDYDVFTRQVEVACRSGASGYIAGRSLWKEGIPLPAAARENFMRTVAADRLDHLAEIAGHHSRPWRDFFPGLADSVQEGWYLSYQA